MAEPRVRLGELLVAAHIITPAQLEEVLTAQKTDGRRLGTLLIESGLVTEVQVTQILSQQLSVPWVSLYHIEFTRQLLNLVPQDLAEKYCLVPIFVRRVRGHGDTLYIAMDDPTNVKATEEVSHWAGLPVRAMIAPPSDIDAAIRVYYKGESPEEVEPDPSVRPPPPPPPRSVSAKPKSPPRGDAQPGDDRSESKPQQAAPNEAAALGAAAALTSTSAPPEAAAPEIAYAEDPESGPPIEAHEISMPAPKRGAEANLVTLTLLDGTQLRLPKLKPGALPGAGEAKGVMTARDLVAALRAASQGSDISQVLGKDVNWQELFAALLALLLRKHLIADWEFVDEWKKKH